MVTFTQDDSKVQTAATCTHTWHAHLAKLEVAYSKISSVIKGMTVTLLIVLTGLSYLICFK